MKKASIPSNMFTVAPGVWGRKDIFVNFYIIQSQVSDDWVLVDTGVKTSTGKVKEMAEYLFGLESVPKAVILTHGHFDHVGSLTKLVEEWDVPVYAHHLEIPYLTGQSNYPPPDSTVGGGLMSSLAFLYKKKPIDVWKHIKVLPADCTVPYLREWKFIHTPGHTPGHISLFRESDSVLIAGDAFVTTKSESALSVLLQTKAISGPPKYFTCDWKAAASSVEVLADLKPKTATTGHGRPMRGQELKDSLKILTKNFSKESVPAQGRYVPYPAITNANGIIYIPPKKQNDNKMAMKAFSVTALVVLGLVYTNYKKKKTIEYENYIDLEYNY